MQIRLGSSAANSRRTSPDRGHGSESQDAAHHTKAPKRSNSFGKGLGMAFASTMTRASEVVEHVGKPRAAPTAGSGPPAQIASATPAAMSSMAAPPTGIAPALDANHLSNYSLRLSELINQALGPTVGHAVPSSSSVANMAKHTPGRSHVPSIDQIVYEGRHLPNRAKIQEFAHTVVAELRYAKTVDAYLLRAVSRASLKSLTLFASRFDSLLISVAKDPSSLALPTTAKEGIHISPALEYNVGLATLLWIVEDALEDCIEGDTRFGPSAPESQGMPSYVDEILTPVRKKMETTILYVLQPVLSGVKVLLTASMLKSVRHPFLSAGSPPQTPAPAALDSPQPPLSPSLASSSAFASPKGVNEAPTVNWLKELQGRLEGSRKLLVPRIEARTGKDGEGWFIGVAIHLIWKSLFILSSRPVDSGLAEPHKAVKPFHSVAGLALPPATQQSIHDANKRAPSPGQLSAALKSVTSVGGGRARKAEGFASTNGLVSPSGIASGVSTPAGSDSTLGHVPGTASAAVKTTGSSSLYASCHSKATAAQVADLLSFQKLALRFCKGFVSDKALAAVAAELSRADNDDVAEGDQQLQEDDEEDELARHALAEALEALKSTITAVQVVDGHLDSVRALIEKRDVSSPRAQATTPAHSDNLAQSYPAPAPEKQGQTQAAPLEPTQVRALRSIPPLLLLHITFCRLPSYIKAPSPSSHRFLSSPPVLFGITWQEYEKSIAGFVGGASWAQAASQRWQREVQALYSDLQERRLELLDRRRHPEHDLQESHEHLASSAVDVADLGTTPKASRHLGSNLGPIFDVSEATPRAAHQLSTPAERSESNLPAMGSSLSRSSTRTDVSQDFSVVSDPSSSGSNLQSPAIHPAVPAVADDVEDLSGSVSSLDMGSATDIGSSNPRGSMSKESKPRFWKSSSHLASRDSVHHNPSDSAQGSGPIGSRGFSLLTRPAFASRTSSPAGSIRGALSHRSRSARRNTDTSRHDSANGHEALTAEDAELADIAKASDALVFFARVIEWAGRSAGVEVKCVLSDKNI